MKYEGLVWQTLSMTFSLQQTLQYIRIIGLLLAVLGLGLSANSMATGGKAPISTSEKIPEEWRSLTAPAGHLIILRKFLEEAKQNSALLARGCDIRGLSSKQEWSDVKSGLVDSSGFLLTVQPPRNDSERILIPVKQYHVNTFSVIPSEDGKLDFYGGNYFTKEAYAGDSEPRIYETKWLVSVQKSTGKIMEISRTVFRGLKRSKRISHFECK